MTMAKYQAKADADDVVEAEQLKVETEVQIAGGVEKAFAGDWLLTGKDGVQRALTNADFEATYEAVKTPALGRERYGRGSDTPDADKGEEKKG